MGWVDDTNTIFRVKCVNCFSCEQLGSADLSVSMRELYLFFFQDIDIVLIFCPALVLSQLVCSRLVEVSAAQPADTEQLLSSGREMLKFVLKSQKTEWFYDLLASIKSSCTQSSR